MTIKLNIISTQPSLVDSDAKENKHYFIEVIKDPALLNCYDKFEHNFFKVIFASHFFHGGT